MSEFNSSNKKNSRVRELLQRLNQSNNDLHDQDDKFLTLNELTQQDDPPPGTFAPQNPRLEEVLTPTVDTKRQAAEDLELLTQMICDRLGSRLKSEMERRGFHQSNRIFSHPTIVTHKLDSAQTALSSLKSEQADVVERLAQEIERLLHHRLIYDRERQGRSVGCLPW